MIDHYSVRRKIEMLLGFSPGVLLSTVKGIPYFLSSLWKYQRLNNRPTMRIMAANLFPLLSDRNESAGTAGGHYFHQDLWAARKVFDRSPVSHLDIGSRVDGFVSHLLVFMPVTIIDVRELNSDINGLSFVRDDATRLSQLQDDSVMSLSSLHAAEHFGLGRYSDPIDPGACFKFMAALERVLARNGNLYFSVPVGRERVEFNAHRVFFPQTIIDSFPSLTLVAFSFVGDDGKLRNDADPILANTCEYGCGLFHFTKI
ncbi:MAG: DUF268 domain-containing protein [Steroidobacteraceae bacterium]